jgi:hypothetical protein
MLITCRVSTFPFSSHQQTHTFILSPIFQLPNMKIAVPVVQNLVARHDLSGRVRQLQTHRNALDSALLRLPNEILLSSVDLLVSDSLIGRGETTGWLAFMST